MLAVSPLKQGLSADRGLFRGRRTRWAALGWGKLMFGLVLFPLTSYTQPYLFSTVAGQGGLRLTLDGTNSSANFYRPRCLAISAAGDFFVTDDTTIRKISVNGTNWIVNTIAGLPQVPGGTDGTNNTARFDTPSGIAADAATNIYVADWGNHTIRKLAPSGTNWVTTTLAGLAGSPGSADGTNQNARLRNPFGLIIGNSGDLFVVDSGNDSVRKISAQGTNWVVTTIVGSSSNSGGADGTNSFAHFREPRDLAMDTNGVLYVSDRLNGTIRKVMPSGTNWIVTTIAGLAGQRHTVDGTNSAARFSGPDGMAVDCSGRLYVTDSVDDNIRQLQPVGTNWVVSTIGGFAGLGGSSDGIGTNALFNYPDNIKVDQSGRVCIADRDNATIRKGIPLPPISIEILKTQVRLSWPVSDIPFVLESSASLPAAGSWTSVMSTPMNSGGRWLVTNDIAGASFYRLRYH